MKASMLEMRFIPPRYQLKIPVVFF